MELGLIRKVDIDDEMQQSYLDYAMSVIVSRALPDARDGLKPVQRRILFAMYDMGLRQDSAYKKSARIVGEVLGKYHPHGDMAVYEAMARMAQDFSMRYMLVDGQGNFGSVDGDPPAAMRYTEARLTPTAIDMINQIDKDTVNFVSNFDDTLQEPEVMPAALPNLLVNGATGIAVGMATNIPPHNLGEVVDALVYMLDRWDKVDDIPIDHLMRYIQGPDFPTGGVIIQDPQGDGLASAYGTGRGKVIVQARAHLEEMVRGRNRIIVTELPYMTNKASLIERIAELVRESHLEGIADLRDESDRQGMRIVIELTKAADPEKILRDLYHRTPMQSTFGITLLALVDGEPRLLTLKQALKVYVEHRLTVVKRRSEYELARARQRAHILEGLRIALQNLDEIISLIRSSPDADHAKKRLMTRFKLSDIQAQAILDMPLRRLAALERKKIEQEYKEVVDLIKDLESLLRSPKRMRQVVIDELQAVRKAYADRRRTQIVRLKEGASLANLLTTTDVVPAQGVWIRASAGGRIARSQDDSLPPLAGSEAPHWILRTNTHDTLYLVSESGKTAAIPVHALPVCENLAEGPEISKVCPLREDGPIAALFALPTKGNGDQEGYLISVSRSGLVKKTALGELPGPSAQAFVLARVNEGDRLGWVLLTKGDEELLLLSAEGMAIRFHENEVRPMGMVAAGVGGIKLAAGDELVAAMTLPAKGEVALAAADGRGKRVSYKDFPVQGRYGQGAIAWKLGKGLRLVGGTAGQGNLLLILHLAKSGAQQVQLGEIPVATRAGQGKSIVEVKPGDQLMTVSVPVGAEDLVAPPAGSGSKAGKDSPASNREVSPARKPRRSTAGEAAAGTPSSSRSAPEKFPALTRRPSKEKAEPSTLAATQGNKQAAPRSTGTQKAGKPADNLAIDGSKAIKEPRGASSRPRTGKPEPAQTDIRTDTADTASSPPATTLDAHAEKGRRGKQASSQAIPSAPPTSPVRGERVKASTRKPAITVPEPAVSEPAGAASESKTTRPEKRKKATTPEGNNSESRDNRLPAVSQPQLLPVEEIKGSSRKKGGKSEQAAEKIASPSKRSVKGNVIPAEQVLLPRGEAGPAAQAAPAGSSKSAPARGSKALQSVPPEAPPRTGTRGSIKKGLKVPPVPAPNAALHKAPDAAPESALKAPPRVPKKEAPKTAPKATSKTPPQGASKTAPKAAVPTAPDTASRSAPESAPKAGSKAGSKSGATANPSKKSGPPPKGKP
jgi:DNA gyrase subunit A